MLVQKIKEDMKDAMRAKDSLKVQTLRGAMAAFTNELVAKNMKPTDEVTDEMATTVLKRLSKQRKDSIDQFSKGGRKDLADKEAQELEIIQAYLPQSASKDEIRAVAEKIKTEMNVTDAAGAGKLMGAVVKQFQGRADGRDVKEVIDSLFAK